MTQLRERISNGEGRHDSLVKVAPWATLAADLNCDGYEDLLVGNGNITGHSAAPDL